MLIPIGEETVSSADFLFALYRTSASFSSTISPPNCSTMGCTSLRYLLCPFSTSGWFFRTFLRKSTKNIGLAFLRESVLGELKRHLCCGEVYVTFLYRSLGQSFPSKSDGQFVVWTSMWCCFAERVGLGDNNVLRPRGSGSAFPNTSAFPIKSLRWGCYGVLQGGVVSRNGLV